jgi:predicted PurR-regulated permease PerM
MRPVDGASGGSRFTLQTAIGVLLGIAVLYLGRQVFIPIALALLLSFLLAPPMIRLQRWGAGKTFAALLVVAVSFSALLFICWVGLGQVYRLSVELPAYRDNISLKIHSLAPGGLDYLQEIKKMLGDFSGDLTKSEQTKIPAGKRPIPVEVQNNARAPLEFLERTAGSVLEPMATAFVVVVFVVFILLGREDLRDRVLRLAGSSRLYLTTQALDDAASRVSRYLLMQFAVNVVYGALVGLGLGLIGIPHPMVWAGLAALLRFIPYVGPWIAAAGPLLLAIGVAPGWDKFAWTFGVYVVLELVVANGVEPYLYGSSTGISAIAILVAAVFWTWLWGPIGLLLSTPLTVCVVVVGRYVPHLEFLGILFGDEPALSPAQRFYQRMIALEAEDAAELTEQLRKDRSLTELYDNVIIPALSLAEEGRHAGFLDAATESYFVENTRELTEELGTNRAASAERKRSATLVCVPAKDGADELACHMLAQLLPDIEVKVLPAGMAGSTLAQAVQGALPDLICVSGVPPQAIRHVAVRCRNLRRSFRDMTIMAAVWSDADLASVRTRIPVGDANHVVCTLKQAVEYVGDLAKSPSTRPEQEADTKDESDSKQEAESKHETAEQIAALEMVSASDGDLPEVLDRMLQDLANALDAPIALLTIAQENGRILRAQRGVPADLAAGLRPIERMLENSIKATGTRIVIEDVVHDRRFEGFGLSENGIHFCVCEPLANRSGKVIGSLLVLDTRPRKIGEREEELLRAGATGTMEALEVRTVAPRQELAAS